MNQQTTLDQFNWLIVGVVMAMVLATVVTSVFINRTGLAENSVNADFEASPTSGEAPLEVSFTDLSAGDIDEWNWTFGDGNTSTLQHPTHTYQDPGTYTVSLEVIKHDPYGDSDTETKIDFITVNEPTFNLTMAEDPAEGGSAIDQTGTSPYTAGTVVDILATPNSGWQFQNWSAPAGSFADANDPDTTFTMPAEDITLTANFIQSAFFQANFDSANSPRVGQTLNVDYTINNLGDVADTQDIRLTLNGQTKATTSSVTIDGGHSHSDTLSWATSSGDQGDYTACVVTEDDSDCQTVTVRSVSASDPTPSQGGIIFTGLALPDRPVTISVLDTDTIATADVDGNFTGSLTLSPGNYTFELKTSDPWAVNNNRLAKSISSLQTVVDNIDITVNNIILPPTLAVNQQQVIAGGWLALAGFGPANVDIEIRITNNQGQSVLTTTVLTNSSQLTPTGEYHLMWAVPDNLPTGQYTALARVNHQNTLSAWSQTVNFNISADNIANQDEPCRLIGDFNCDGVVDAKDLSILAYYLDKDIVPARVDLTNTERATISDLSAFLEHRRQWFNFNDMVASADQSQFKYRWQYLSFSAWSGLIVDWLGLIGQMISLAGQIIWDWFS